MAYLEQWQPAPGATIETDAQGNRYLVVPGFAGNETLVATRQKTATTVGPPASVKNPFSVDSVPLDPRVLSFTATMPLIGSRLIARTAAGLVHYDATNLAHRHALLGVALNSANAGQLVRVQVEGLVKYVGWGLTPDAVYRAGSNGQLVTSAAGLAFSQIIGRATDTDTLLFEPQSIIKL